MVATVGPRRVLLVAVVVGLAGCFGDRPPVPDDQDEATSPPITAEEADVDRSETRYGDHPEQVADLVLPGGAPPDAGWQVVVLIHGGFWREGFRRDLMDPLADDLAARGIAAWNVEYRRVGGDGGWPTTLTDVAAAVDHLPVLDVPLDLERVAVVGHSAGGHLALWVAGRSRLTGEAPGADPVVAPCLAVGQAPVADLTAGVSLDDGAVTDLLGGTPAEVPDRYAVADPVGLVGHGTPVVLVHGEADVTVPVEQSRRYLAAATAAGDPVRLVTLPGDHFSVIDPQEATWAAVVAALEDGC